MPVALHASAEHGAVENVEGSEQRRCSMVFVVMGHGATLSGLERQAGLGAVERLDLRYFVDGQHDRVGRRVHVEADDVAQLGGELGVVGALEGADTCRPCFLQMRCTELSPMATALAIASAMSSWLDASDRPSIMGSARAETISAVVRGATSTRRPGSRSSHSGRFDRFRRIMVNIP